MSLAPAIAVSHPLPMMERNQFAPRRRLAVDTPIYGLDIETDTTTNGLDPNVAAVVAIGASAAAGDTTFVGDEPTILRQLDAWLADTPPGVLVTWYGGGFDLPFLAERARRHAIEWGLRLVPDPIFADAWRGSWHAHAHLDAWRLYAGDVGRALPWSTSLKSVARLVGLDPIVVDVRRIHELDDTTLRAYVASDARLARLLVERRWASARRFADPAPLTPVR